MENIQREDLLALLEELSKGWDDWMATRDVVEKLIQLLDASIDEGA